MILVNGHQVNVTSFPDKTRQVWKQTDELINSVKEKGLNISWFFEGQEEFFDLVQLQYYFIKLINDESGGRVQLKTTLTCPYMPYARQDKEVSNESCFALKVVLDIFDTVESLTVFDVHNPKPFEGRGFVFNNIMPYAAIKSVVDSENIDLLVYPDKGAAARYDAEIIGKPSITLDKVRDQLTGNITGLSIKDEDKDKLTGKILVVDDICDGGRTFIEAAKLLGDTEKFLYVSHGIFSKGLDCLYDAGYTAIYTVNDLSVKSFGQLIKREKNVDTH